MLTYSEIICVETCKDMEIWIKIKEVIKTIRWLPENFVRIRDNSKPETGATGVPGSAVLFDCDFEVTETTIGYSNFIILNILNIGDLRSVKRNSVQKWFPGNP